MKRKTDFSQKPYNRCLFCTYRMEHRCDGPRTSAMDLARWIEYMCDMLEANGLTKAYVAEKTGLAPKTVSSILSPSREQDIMRETARLIEDAIIGSSNQYPCYLAFEESHASDKSQTLEHTTAVIDGIHASYEREMQKIRDEAQKKIDYLLEEINRLRLQADYLRTENDRKAAIIEKLMK